MKRYIWIVPVVALVFAISGPFAAGQNGGDRSMAVPPVTLSNATRGVVFKTAAINADATVANCFRCNRINTVHLSTGTYQVGFDENVTANAGWSRWVQVDTLTIGSIFGISCTTADRAGLVTGVFVECVNAAGALADTSFFIFVAR
jgi:hypothetical protein